MNELGDSRPSNWYKDAVIYQLHVKSFFDANDDGVGDFAGLTSKLDYLQDLGVTALWLLPFYPSPGHDDGYDIGDYRRINPDFGTMRERGKNGVVRAQNHFIQTEEPGGGKRAQHPGVVRLQLIDGRGDVGEQEE